MPAGIYSNIACLHGSHPDFLPREHQKEVVDYFLNKSKYKGLLLYHRLGSGKSCSSILVADEMIEKAKVTNVYILTPGSLRQNFIEEYCDKCGIDSKTLKKFYTFITTNYAVGNKLPDFNNSLVVIDEIHNLINGVKNQSTHATLIYNALMESNCRILALTGTPVYNFIWEWPILGNLLKPGEFPNILKGGKLDEIAFTKLFIVDKDNNVSPKDPKWFSVKMRGIVSYFPGESGGLYPEVIHEDPIQIQMTIPQNAEYWNIATWEQNTRLKGQPDKSMMRSNPAKYYKALNDYIVASKYIMSRMRSNFYYPEEYRSSTKSECRDEIDHVGEITKYRYKSSELGPTRKFFADQLQEEFESEYLTGKDNSKAITKEVAKEIKDKVDAKLAKHLIKENVQEIIGWIDKKLFNKHQLTDVYSRKVAVIISNIVRNWKAKHMVFTFFKTKAGVNMIHALFKMCGVRTAIYSGDISDSQRREILKDFNAEKNRYGDKIKVLLVTEAGAEGINLLETQHIHIMESSTREMKIQQAIGRVVRFRSHMVEGRKPMPKSEQVVHVWRYWSVSDPEPFTVTRTVTNDDGSSEKKEKVIINKTCVDEILYNKGRISVNIIQNFLRLIKEQSVTYYDRSTEKIGILADYVIKPISEKMEKAYNISDDRYKAEHMHLGKDTFNTPNVNDEIEGVVDEKKDDTFVE